MKTLSKSTSSKLIAALLWPPLLMIAALTSTGCARDRDVDDYKRTKLNEDLAKLEGVTGDYAGDLVSAQSGESMGHVRLQLEADTRVNSFNDQQPVLRGTLQFQGSSIVKIVFQNTAFDPDKNSFKSSLVSTANPNISLDLKGSVTGAKLEATLESFGYPELGGILKLEKVVTPQDSFGGPLDPNSKSVDSFKKTFKGRYNAKNITLEINNLKLVPEDRFIDIFMPTRRVDVTLVFSPENALPFSDVKWDSRTQSFTASATRNSSDGPFLATLNCQSKATNDSNAPATLNCRFASSLANNSIQITFVEDTTSR